MALMLCIPIVFADVHPVETIEQCVGTISVEVQTDHTNYTMVDCNLDGQFWKCPCKNPTSIQINISVMDEKSFDFITWYYVEELPVNASDLEKDNARRKKEISNVVFEEPKSPSKPFPISGALMIFFFIGFIVVLFVIVLGYWGYKKLIKDDDDEPTDDEFLWRQLN